LVGVEHNAQVPTFPSRFACRANGVKHSRRSCGWAPCSIGLALCIYFETWLCCACRSQPQAQLSVRNRTNCYIPVLAMLTWSKQHTQRTCAWLLLHLTCRSPSPPPQAALRSSHRIAQPYCEGILFPVGSHPPNLLLVVFSTPRYYHRDISVLDLSPTRRDYSRCPWVHYSPVSNPISSYGCFDAVVINVSRPVRAGFHSGSSFCD
jgi:hypothetical protein